MRRTVSSNKRKRGFKGSNSPNNKEREFKRGEVPEIIGSLRGAKPLFRNLFSPFPLKRGRGIKGDGV